MFRFLTAVVAVVSMGALVGCSPSEPAQDTNEEETAVSDGLEVDESAIDVIPVEPETPAPAETEEAALEMPEGFPEDIHVWSEIILEDAEVIDADANQFRLSGTVPANPEEVVDYYEEWFRDNGWEEDMIMVQETNGVVSFHTDTLLQYVEAEVGGLGSIVSITTGNY